MDLVAFESSSKEQGVSFELLFEVKVMFEASESWLGFPIFISVIGWSKKATKIVILQNYTGTRNTTQIPENYIIFFTVKKKCPEFRGSGTISHNILEYTGITE